METTGSMSQQTNEPGMIAVAELARLAPGPADVPALLDTGVLDPTGPPGLLLLTISPRSHPAAPPIFAGQKVSAC